MGNFMPWDIWAGLKSDKREKVNYGADYVPEEFWKEYGKHYLGMFSAAVKESVEKPEILKETLHLNLQALIGRVSNFEPKSVLEVGCGFGRCLPFVHSSVEDIERLVGIEFSPTMIEKAKEYLEKYPKRDKITVVQGDARNLPFKDDEFDLVYTHVCLTHIPPEFIPKVTGEISRVAKNHIVHLERFFYPYEHPNPHRWSHMLPPHYLDRGWKLMEMDTLDEFPDHHTKAIVLKRI